MDWIDNSIGVYAKGLIYRARRTEVLAGNIANADTPGYKARDLDFSAILRGERSASLRTATAHPRHIDFNGTLEGAEIVMRTPNRFAPNGNTVEPEVELAAYAENALRFQASAQFLDGAINGLRKAWRGE